MQTKASHVLTLIAVIVLATALTIAMSGGVLARSTFQSSIEPLPEVTEPALLTPTLTLSAEATPIPVLTLSAEATPTPPVATSLPPAAPGFLPAPTLVDPNTLAPGRPSPLQPGNQPLVGPAVPPEATPTPAPVSVSGPAELIDSGVVALSYLWLCCGALFLVAAALVVFWVSRRSKRR